MALEMENPPTNEDVCPIENGDVPRSCWIEKVCTLHESYANWSYFHPTSLGFYQGPVHVSLPVQWSQ